MIAITVVALFLTDPLIALVGLVVFPLVFAVNVVYSQVMSPRMQRAQQLRAEVSEIAHESFDAALVVKTLGREAVGDRALRRPRRGAARRAGRRRPGARPVRPADGGAAEPRHARRPADRRRPGRRRQHRRRRAWSSIAYLFTLLALPDPRDRLGAGRPAARAGRLRPGHPGARRHRRDAVRPGRRRRPAPAAPALGVTDVGFTFDGVERPDARRRHLRRPGRQHGRRRRAHRLGQVHPRRPAGPAGRPGRRHGPARRRRPAPAARGRGQRPGRLRRPGHLPLRRHRARQRHPRRARSPTTRSGRRCAWPPPTTSSPRCPTGSTPGSASAARPCPAGSGSGWRWPAPSSAGRGCWCSTTPPAPSTPPSRRASSTPCATSDEPGDRRGRRLPAGHDRARRRGGLARAGPGARPRHATSELLADVPGYAALVRAYAQAEVAA